MKTKKPFTSNHKNIYRKLLVNLYADDRIASVISIEYDGFKFYAMTLSELPKGNTLYFVLPRNENLMRKILKEKLPVVTVPATKTEVLKEHEFSDCANVLHRLVHENSFKQTALEFFNVVDSSSV